MKNTRYYLLLIIITLLFTPVMLQAQTKDTLSTSEKIDSIYSLQKKMYDETRNEPLADKKYGFEFNVFRLLLMNKAVSLSGSFSFFDISRSAEIAFPFYYQDPKDSYDLTEFTLDCHYRYFLGNTQNGFYLSAFVRYAHLRGMLGVNNLFENQQDNPRGTENKLGLGFGLGYRIFSYKGFYWGISLSIGRYFIGENDKFQGSFLSLDDDEKQILDMELLKFGYAF
jgi:hypothetical protein